LADVIVPLPADVVPVSGETGEVYVQVDINIRKDEHDWENVMIFHAYGDLGMILGRLAASIGLQLGELGLKMSSQALVPTYSPTFVLSSSIPDIFPFFGLSVERWREGFATQHEAFEWVASSTFYVHGRLSDRTARAKTRTNRGMYHAFFQWSEARASPAAGDESQSQDVQEAEKEAVIESVRAEALTFFGKQEEHDALARANQRRLRLKAMWNGRKVGEWTGGNSRIIGRVMDLMRKTIGEEKISRMTEEELEQHVLQAKEAVELQLEERQLEERQAQNQGANRFCQPVDD